MQKNYKTHLSQSRRVPFDVVSTHNVSLKNSKYKENIANIKRTFSSDSSESLDKILEKCIKAIDLSD